MKTQLHDEQNKLLGTYRARVVEVDIEQDGEKNCYGSVKVYIPDLMNNLIDKNIDEFKSGILAYPSNNPIGGYNSDDPDKTSFYASSVYIPRKNSYVRVYFENGDPSRCFYLGPWQDKLAKLPPENRGTHAGEEPHKVTTIFKSGEGRSIVISDSRNTERVEITGKKRDLSDSDGPQGNSSSVLKIDGNQTTILIDERSGKEKILIKTYKGDFLNINTDERTLEVFFKNDIAFKTDGVFSIESKRGIIFKTNGDFAVSSKQMIKLVSSLSMVLNSKISIYMNSVTNIIEGAISYIQSKMPKGPSFISRIRTPKGDR